MESNIGVFGFTRKVRGSTASFCDMSVFLTAKKSRDLRDAHQSYCARNMHCEFSASFLGKIPNTPKLLPMPGKKFTWAVLKLWDLCLYICGKDTKFALHHRKMSTTKRRAIQILHISTFRFTFKCGYNDFISKYTDINSLHVTQIDLLHNDTFCST